MILHAERVELRPQQVAEVLEKIRMGWQVSIAGASGQGRSSLVRAVASGLGSDAIVVRVPEEFDKIEATVLAVAEQLGFDVAKTAAGLLRQSPGDPSRALECLSEELRRTKRKLLVDDADALSLRRSPDRELADAFFISQLRLGRWIRRHAVLWTTRSNRRDTPLATPEKNLVPYSLGTEWDVYTRTLWEAVRENPKWFRVALSRTLLTGKPQAHRALSAIGEARHFAETWAMLPVHLQKLVRTLAVHGRPLPIAILNSLLGDEAESLRQEALRTLLAESAGSYIWLYEPWIPWVLNNVPSSERGELHQELARAFVNSMQATEGRDARALSVVEAHRHFLAVPDLAQARQHAQFGVGLLLEYGRSLSLERRYKDAAQVYEAALDVVPALRGERLGAQARAYAVHYLHYNRFKAELDPITKTEAGYREAVRDWPANALFWSRLARARFVMNQPESAFALLDEAQVKVPEHPFKANVLLVRTVSRLVWRGLLQDALLVWGDYQPVGSEKLIENTLIAALQKGWDSNCLRTRKQQVYFHQPVQIVVRREAADFVCEIAACEFSDRGMSPAAAVENVVKALRAAALFFHRRLPHTLSAEERRRKGLLLGHVDLIRSGLVTPIRSTTRVLGRIERVGAELRFRVLDSSGTSFVLSEAMLAEGEVGRLFYARVPTGSGGEPTAPVQELEPTEDEDSQSLWDEWLQISSQRH